MAATNYFLGTATIAADPDQTVAVFKNCILHRAKLPNAINLTGITIVSGRFRITMSDALPQDWVDHLGLSLT